jgi:hypothetical protein
MCREATCDKILYWSCIHAAMDLQEVGCEDMDWIELA